jgi:hypothetical protein
MSSLKKTWLKQMTRVMSDPRVMTLMQDERVMKAVMVAMSVPGRAQTLGKGLVENVARTMALATEAEVKDLRRTVRKLEDEMAQLKNGR